MNAINRAQIAYSSATAPIRTDRGNEYDAFARVTRNLKSANAKINYPGFIQALHKNRELWTLLAINVADPENALPSQLRAQIFYLAEFTIDHTSKIIAGKADSSSLIDVNTLIMRGLAERGEKV
ncbi:MAG: flagellar biosynthesis regulator FlaF [Paracoccaceae bacterium]